MTCFSLVRLEASAVVFTKAPLRETDERVISAAQEFFRFRIQPGLVSYLQERFTELFRLHSDIDAVRAIGDNPDLILMHFKESMSSTGSSLWETLQVHPFEHCVRRSLRAFEKMPDWKNFTDAERGNVLDTVSDSIHRLVEEHAAICFARVFNMRPA